MQPSVDMTQGVNDTIGGLVAAMQKEGNQTSQNGDGDDYRDNRMLESKGKSA